MSRHPTGEHAMSGAERQARYRAARAAGVAAVRVRRPAEHRSRAKQWCDAVAALLDLQAYYAAWQERLPENLRDSATGVALQAMVELDLAPLAETEPPRGFGRDEAPPAMTAPLRPCQACPGGSTGCGARRAARQPLRGALRRAGPRSLWTTWTSCRGRRANRTPGDTVGQAG